MVRRSGQVAPLPYGAAATPLEGTMSRLCWPFVAMALLLAGCGSGDDGADAADVLQSSDDDGGGTSGGDGGDGGAGGDGGDDADGAGGSGGDGGPDDDDAAEITGNPDLDLEELAEVAPDAAEALDDIDDIVSIGDCESELVGLAMTVIPDDWLCRVLDAPVGGMDGFTLFDPANPSGLQITIGSPSPLGPPCEALQLCDEQRAIDLGATFNMMVVEVAGVQFVYGNHESVEAEAVIVTATALSDEDLELVTEVLNGVVEI